MTKRKSTSARPARDRHSGSEIVRRYTKGKKLFGKLSGTFVFHPKPAEDKKRQLKLPL
jgi:hypothetical protein